MHVQWLSRWGLQTVFSPVPLSSWLRDARHRVGAFGVLVTAVNMFISRLENKNYWWEPNHLLSSLPSSRPVIKQRADSCFLQLFVKVISREHRESINFSSNNRKVILFWMDRILHPQCWMRSTCQKALSFNIDLDYYCLCLLVPFCQRTKWLLFQTPFSRDRRLQFCCRIYRGLYWGSRHSWVSFAFVSSISLSNYINFCMFLFAPAFNSSPPAVLLRGRQKTAKFNNQEADIVAISIMLYRFTQFSSDIIVCFNDPIL